MPFLGLESQEITFRLLFGLVLCTVLAYSGHRKRALTASGAAVSWLVGMVVILLGGLPWLVLILIFFVAGAAATKYKYKAKQALGVAEERMGARSWQNVLANGISPVLFVVSEFISPGAVFVVGYLGAVSTAMADTLSSEIGMTSSRRPRLITNLKQVTPGTHGGVSMLGTTASLVGSAVLGIFAWALHIEAKGEWLLPAVVGYCIFGGLIGCTVDSLLGALFERKGKMSNSQVNLVSTLAGALAAIGLYMVL